MRSLKLPFIIISCALSVYFLLMLKMKTSPAHNDYLFPKRLIANKTEQVAPTVSCDFPDIDPWHKSLDGLSTHSGIVQCRSELNSGAQHVFHFWFLTFDNKAFKLFKGYHTLMIMEA